MLKEELRVEPVVQEVIFFFLPPKVERSEHLFFWRKKCGRSAKSVLFIVLRKVPRLRGCDPIKRAKFRLIYACDVGVWLRQGSAPLLLSSNLWCSNRSALAPAVDLPRAVRASNCLIMSATNRIERKETSGMESGDQRGVRAIASSSSSSLLPVQGKQNGEEISPLYFRKGRK